VLWLAACFLAGVLGAVVTFTDHRARRRRGLPPRALRLAEPRVRAIGAVVIVLAAAAVWSGNPWKDRILILAFGYVVTFAVRWRWMWRRWRTTRPL
jgi:4-hydroxybenzoate polyprenyltransferase